MIKHLPNFLSISRAVLGFIVAALILSEQISLHITAIVVFSFAALTDYFDGWVARKYGVTSNTGKWLDPLADKVLTLGCLWAFAARGLIPEWVFFLILVREALVTFCRTGWGLSGVTLGAELAGKGKLVLQVFWIFSCFAYLLKIDGAAFFTGNWARMIAPTVMAATFASLALTWYSGFSFLNNNRQLFITPFFAKYTLAAGVGLLPKAPGTWGTLAGLIVAVSTHNNPLWYWALFFIIAWVAYFYWSQYEAQFGKDPSFFVLDEVCGIFLTYILVPLNWKTVLTGFILFRLFDIWKPFPARQAEKLPGYWGIMLDDLIAGVYAAVVLWLLPL